MDLELRGRVALVAGASRGIGRAGALGLAREGCDVTLLARSEPALVEAAAEARALGVCPGRARAADRRRRACECWASIPMGRKRRAARWPSSRRTSS